METMTFDELVDQLQAEDAEMEEERKMKIDSIELQEIMEQVGPNTVVHYDRRRRCWKARLNCGLVPRLVSYAAGYSNTRIEKSAANRRDARIDVRRALLDMLLGDEGQVG